jgi:predicted nucleotidyltransferase
MALRLVPFGKIEVPPAAVHIALNQPRNRGYI